VFTCFPFHAWALRPLRTVYARSSVRKIARDQWARGAFGTWRTRMAGLL